MNGVNRSSVDIESLVRFLQPGNVLLLSGAGISTESG
ncbi:MAG: NAD-dependent protein deacetylase 1, partial [Spirochaetaceae bacterium]